MSPASAPHWLFALAAGAAALAGLERPASADPLRADVPEETRFRAGAFVGGQALSRHTGLGNPATGGQAPRSAPLLGLRAGLVAVPNLLHGATMSPRLHLEAEASFATSATRGSPAVDRQSYFAAIFGWRAQARVELWPHRKLRPFALLGVGGATLVSRSPWLASPDTDPVLSWGAGAEYEFNPRAGVRVDVRQGLTSARLRRAALSHELHAGFVVRFGQTRPAIERRIFVEGPPPDSQGQRAASRCGGGGDCGLGVDFGARPRAQGARVYAQNGELDVSSDERAPTRSEAARSSDEAEAPPTATGELTERLAELAERLSFEAESADLEPEAHEALAELAALMGENQDLRIEIAGHTDAQGTRSVNVMLSHARARKVARFLIERGIAAERLETTGYGPDRPVDTNETAAGRAANRRIEIQPL